MHFSKYFVRTLVIFTALVKVNDLKDPRKLVFKWCITG